MLSKQWQQRFAEGGVIVVSILLAFAIDAWWDNYQEYDQHTQRMIRVAAELQANSRRIELKQADLERSIEATSTMMSWMGPVPDNVEFDLYTSLDKQSLSIGTFSLLRRATDDYLSSANPASGDDDGIRETLAEWHRRGDNLEQQYSLLRDSHERLVNYFANSTAIPVRKSMQDFVLMGKHPASRFPLDLTAHFSDPLVENHYAAYLLRLEFVSRQMSQFLSLQAELSQAIENSVAQRR